MVCSRSQKATERNCPSKGVHHLLDGNYALTPYFATDNGPVLHEKLELLKISEYIHDSMSTNWTELSQ